MTFNDTGDVSDSTLWESFKVVIRGFVISYEATQKKQRRSKLLEMDKQLTMLVKQYRMAPSSCVLKDIVKLKHEYNSILSKQVCTLLLKVKHKQFELGDKPGPLLSRQLRGTQASRAIHKIKTPSNSLVTDPFQINDSFRKFYEELYSAIP